MLKHLMIFALAIVAGLAIGCSKSEDSGTSPDGGGGGHTITGSGITVGQVDGAAGSGSIYTGQTITFHLYYANTSGQAVVGFTNGFRIYSPGGAHWGGLAADTTGIGGSMVDIGPYFTYLSNDGSGADTVGFGGVRITASGIPDGFDGDGIKISIGPISSSYAGSTICIDSAFYPSAGQWLWVLADQTNVIPEWGGPYCWTITN